MAKEYLTKVQDFLKENAVITEKTAEKEENAQPDAGEGKENA